MSYNKGNKVQAQDWADVQGGYPCTSAFPTSAAATAKMAALFGVGYGDRGYGQLTLPLANRPQGTAVNANDWANMLLVGSTINNHTGSGLTPTGVYITGSQIKATNPFSGYTYAQALALFDANRYNTAANAMTYTVTGSNVYGSTWGYYSKPTLTYTSYAQFNSEDDARYFFNSGGDIRLILSHPPATTAQNINWKNALSALGSLVFKAHSFTRTGSGGTVNSIGYYELTTSNQTLLSGVIGTGAYSANRITVQARADSIPGVNAGRGSKIWFTITLSDSHVNSYSDFVSAGTTLTHAYNKATTYLTIKSPTIAW